MPGADVPKRRYGSRSVIGLPPDIGPRVTRPAADALKVTWGWEVDRPLFNLDDTAPLTISAFARGRETEMFGLFFHPRCSDDGRPVAVRVVAGQQSAATTDAPSPVIVDRVSAPVPDVKSLRRATAALDEHLSGDDGR